MKYEEKSKIKPNGEKTITREGPVDAAHGSYFQSGIRRRISFKTF